MIRRPRRSPLFPTRRSSDLRPWSERKKYIWWDSAQGKWTGFDRPDFPETKAPDTPPRADGVGVDLHSGSDPLDRKSTRLNSSHGYISYAVFCLKKKHRNDRT